MFKDRNGWMYKELENIILKDQKKGVVVVKLPRRWAKDMKLDSRCCKCLQIVGDVKNQFLSASRAIVEILMTLEKPLRSNKIWEFKCE